MNGATDKCDALVIGAGGASRAVLAGLQQVPVSERVFSSKLDFAVRMEGPVAPGEGQEVLAWLEDPAWIL